MFSLHPSPIDFLRIHSCYYNYCFLLYLLFSFLVDFNSMTFRVNACECLTSYKITILIILLMFHVPCVHVVHTNRKMVREKLNDYMQIGRLIKIQTISTILVELSLLLLLYSNILLWIFDVCYFVWWFFFHSVVLLLCAGSSSIYSN